MRKYNVLITGVGAIIGYGLINSLRKSKYDVHIVGMDIYSDAYGRFICDEFVQAILASDPAYPDFIKKIIDEKNIDLVLFGTEQEIQRLFAEKDAMGEYYKKLVINSEAVLDMSEDKWKTYLFSVENGFTPIPSRLEGTFSDIAKEFGVPFLLKPRKSYACKGIEMIDDEESFDFYKKRAGEQFMVQRIIGDKEHEYTASVFGFGDGSCSSSIVMKRKLSQEGATAKAEIFFDKELDKLIRRYVEILKPIGPTNFQFRSEGAQYYLLEVNPRISSSTSIRQAFGYNEAEMCIEYFVENRRPENRTISEGKAIRYIADYIEVKC